MCHQAMTVPFQPRHFDSASVMKRHVLNMRAEGVHPDGCIKSRRSGRLARLLPPPAYRTRCVTRAYMLATSHGYQRRRCWRCTSLSKDHPVIPAKRSSRKVIALRRRNIRVWFETIDGLDSSLMILDMKFCIHAAGKRGTGTMIESGHNRRSSKASNGPM